MFIVVTGLDGSGTSSVAKGLNTIDKDSVLLKSPSSIYSDRKSRKRTIRCSIL